jgi:hypothetical protein
MIFSGKEKGKRKKRNEYKVAFQQIQVQQYGIIYSHCISHFMLFSFLNMQYLVSTPYCCPSGAFIILCITTIQASLGFFHAIK